MLYGGFSVSPGRSRLLAKSFGNEEDALAHALALYRLTGETMGIEYEVEQLPEPRRQVAPEPGRPKVPPGQLTMF